MRAVVTRVKSASVAVKGRPTQEIAGGLLVCWSAQEGDHGSRILPMVDKVCNLRIFEDDQGKMNLSLRDVAGEILVVSQFTLLGRREKGAAPALSMPARPARQRRSTTAQCRLLGTGIPIKTGTFQAHMEVASANDGPVTILLDSRKLF